MPQNENENDTFSQKSIEEIQIWVDKRRKYEKVIVWAWMVPVTFFIVFAYMNVLLVTYIPYEFSCIMPDDMPDLPNSKPNDSQIIIYEEFGNETIPDISCKMYDFLNNDDPIISENNFTYYKELYKRNANIWLKEYQDDTLTPYPNSTECIFGMDIKKTKIFGTTKNNITERCPSIIAETMVLKGNILTISQVGNLLGAILFGTLADRFGRLKVIIFLSVKMIVLGSINSTLNNIYAIYVIRFLLSMGLPAIYQAVLISVLEQVRESHRAFVGVISSVSYSIGQSLMGVLAHFMDWYHMSLITSLASIYTLITTFFLIQESPRWLIARGELQKTIRALHKISKYRNKEIAPKQIMEEIIPLFEKKNDINSNVAGSKTEPLYKQIWKLKKLKVRIVLIIINWIVNLQLYMGPMLRFSLYNDDYLTGWSLLSVIEIPACFLTYALFRCMGRRTCHTLFMVFTDICLIIVTSLLLADFHERSWPVYILIIAAKFGASITFMIIYLQAAELLPTIIRTSVSGMANLIAIACFIATPKFMFMMSHPWESYGILSLFGFVGIFTALFLPETSKKLLPQTLKEAEIFT